MTVAEKTQIVQSLFRETQQDIESKSVDTVLSSSDGEFSSVVYEAVSVSLAAQDIQNNDSSFSQWTLFRDKHATVHGSQIYVGLGWALCENGISDFTFFENFPSVWRWRILDGYGYYSGLFKRRETIRTQQIPDFLSGDDLCAFNQGVGRSLWYLSQGDTERLNRSISLFNETRQKDLWRGIGLAATYVGGLDASLLGELQELTGEHVPQFKCGALMALAARNKSGISSTDSTFITNTLSLSLSENEERIFSQEGNYLALLQEIEANL